ncbi:hypothetical protein [Halomontanus rarus]|uniref:hypothetical protein n=1 Tax=Halomontanus rarus TaxID=3034020 RepID=UPI00307B7567
MVDTSKVTRRTALGFIASGAFVMASESYGYSHVSANRVTNMGVADDPAALLGIEGATDPDTTPTFTNRTDHEMIVTLDSSESDIEFDVGDDETWMEPPVQFSLTVGESEVVAMQAPRETITVDMITHLESDGDAIGNIELQREFDIPQAGQVDLTPYFKEIGGSGKYEFELENTGDIDVTITKLGINQTSNGNAAKVGGGQNDSILKVDGGSIVSTSIPIDNTEPDTVGNADNNYELTSFDGNQNLNTGMTKNFAFDRFRTADDKNAKMSGEDVKFTLEFEDGSTLTVTVCPNSCSI